MMLIVGTSRASPAWPAQERIARLAVIMLMLLEMAQFVDQAVGDGFRHSRPGSDNPASQPSVS